MTTTVNDKTKSPLRLPQKVVVCEELGLPAAYLLDFCAGAGRGSRTPKTRRSADFESAASASSAIPALLASA